MKKSELMIGDWVSFYGTNVRIESIDKEFGIHVDGNDNPIMEHEILPVELTAHILEVNGWEHYDANEITGTMERCFLDGFGNAYVFSDGHIEFDVRGIMRGDRDHVRMELSYVHEFQHMLRLCGLNELADNVKVKSTEE